MDVSIEAIHFNHDSTSENADALTIRKNFSEEITGPEWMLDRAQQLPVAYARTQGNTLSIAVQLKRNNLKVKGVDVSATTGSFLGNIATFHVDFPGTKLQSGFKILPLRDVSLDKSNVGREVVKIEWTLSTKVNGRNESNKQYTDHVFYTLLDKPKPPWGPDINDPKYDYEVPWAEVLELACKWAEGASDATTAASMITREIYGLGLKRLDCKPKLRFDPNSSFSRLAYNGTQHIKFTEFLDLVKKPGGIMNVSCTDCAILVSSFANILGCNLYQSQMGPRFRTNKFLKIGAVKEGPDVFEYHEVAWEHPCTAVANLFDCFLELDSDPSTSEFTPLLPINIRFGNHEVNTYHYLLVKNKTDCDAWDDQKTRRRIAHKTFVVKRIRPELEQILKEQFDFASWQKLPSPGRLFSGPIDKLNGEFLSGDWDRKRTTILDGEADVLELNESIWQSSDRADVAVRVLSYRCVSVSTARDFLLNLLGDFQRKVVNARYASEKDQDQFIVGDLAFSGPEDHVLLFARSNVVVFLQNAGESSVSLLSFAQAIDEQILKVLDQEEMGPVQSGTPSGTKPTIQKKEKKMISRDDIVAQWSSSRPQLHTNPTDLRRNGVFKIEDYDPRTGRVEGDYYDLEEFYEVHFEGLILPAAGTYAFLFNHDVQGTTKRRMYHGTFISVVNGVFLVSGTWKHEDTDSHKTDEVKNKETGTTTGQEEGIWVLTKP